MGKYGKGMRDCCDSVAASSAPHIAGCPMSNPVSVGDDLVERLNRKFLHRIDHSGEDWRLVNPDGPEAASKMVVLKSERDALFAERVSIIATKREQIASLMDERNNLTDIVNSGIDDVAGAKLDELEERATTAEARLKAAREALSRVYGLVGPLELTDRVMAIRRELNAALNPKAPS